MRVAPIAGVLWALDGSDERGRLQCVARNPGLARGQFDEEEFVAGLREIRETGGLELKDFIRELEQEAAPRE